MVLEQDADPIWEVSEIAKIVGRTERQTFHLLQSGAIPGRKIGGRWMVDRNVLNRFLKGAEAAA